MKCPVCKDKHHIEIDMHSDGFAESLEECGHCGSVWTRLDGKPSILHGPTVEMTSVSAGL